MNANPLRAGIPPRWATAWGEDEYGVFAAFTVNEVEHRMRWIPPGRFVMGSPENEAGRLDNEGPQHEVVLTEGYWLGDAPVTQALWTTVMEENPSCFQDAERPVEQVSWHHCQDFVERLNRKAMQIGVRLPTEAEWERACRAGTQTATWAGDLKILGESSAPILDAIAWYGGNSGVEYDLEGGEDSGDWSEKQYVHTSAGTRKVRKKQPNPFGLFDMLGNVWEWCSDWNGHYDSAPAVNPTGSAAHAHRILRGASWNDFARNVRAARRISISTTKYDPIFGFRLARDQG